jgi:hypothetical protein
MAEPAFTRRRLSRNNFIWPLLIAFLLFQRQIVQGISNTGLKG